MFINEFLAFSLGVQCRTLRKICGTNCLKNMSLAVVSRLTQISRSN